MEEYTRTSCITHDLYLYPIFHNLINIFTNNINRHLYEYIYIYINIHRIDS